MLVRLDILKVVQASAHLLRRHDGVLTRIRLLKLLYIADRELLTQTHRPLTGDRPIAMDHGPVLSHVYDLLKGTTTGVEVWNAFIAQAGPYTHKLISDPGLRRLSKVEIEKLDELVARYWPVDDWELTEITHAFPEWQRNKPAKGKRNVIPTEHVLEAVGLGSRITQLTNDARAEAELDSLLGLPR